MLTYLEVGLIKKSTANIDIKDIISSTGDNEGISESILYSGEANNLEDLHVYMGLEEWFDDRLEHNERRGFILPRPNNIRGRNSGRQVRPRTRRVASSVAKSNGDSDSGDPSGPSYLLISFSTTQPYNIPLSWHTPDCPHMGRGRAA